MNMDQKGFANIVLVVVVVILVGAIGYFAFVKKPEQIAQQPTPTLTTTQTEVPTPTPTQTTSPTKTPASTPKDETANWKTYTNAQYGFEFKYPSTLDSIVVNVTSGSDFYKRYVSIDIDTPAKIAQMKQPNSGAGGVYPLFRFGAFIPKDSIGDLGCGSDPVLRTVTIGGVSASMCGGEDIAAPEGNMHLQFTRDNTILFSAQSGFYSGSNKQIVDKILATFKFTN